MQGDIMLHNKNSLERQLKALEVAVKMEKDIREVLADFKHYKQVNSRFTDAIKAKGYHAYICKDKWSTVLNVSCNQHDINVNDRVDFRIYVSECMERKPITWEQIEHELMRNDFQGRLDQTFQKLKMFEIEKVKFKGLVEFMKKMSFNCFDLWGVNQKLEEMLDYANK